MQHFIWPVCTNIEGTKATVKVSWLRNYTLIIREYIREVHYEIKNSKEYFSRRLRGSPSSRLRIELREFFRYRYGI